MPWREALSLTLSYPVWYDDGPDKLLNIDAPRFSLGFDSFEATVSKGKDELGQYLFRSLESLRALWASKSTLGKSSVLLFFPNYSL